MVDVRLDEGEQLSVYDADSESFIPIHKRVFPETDSLDLAFLPSALGPDKTTFFQILQSHQAVVGAEVFTHGFFKLDTTDTEIHQGYFSGCIVNIGQPHGHISFSLPFPILEGMSGSPVLAEDNGPKLIGVAHGNSQSRILQSEVVEYRDERETLRETINRIVEFGQAYHVSTITAFLIEAIAASTE